MLPLTIFGIGMFSLGSIMLFKPLAFANGIKSFSEKTWFHKFEISSRLILGIIFLLFANNTPYPVFLYILGGILCFVSIFLTIIGYKKHRQFALLTSKIGLYFRPIGLVSQVLGAILIYISLK